MIFGNRRRTKNEEEELDEEGKPKDKKKSEKDDIPDVPTQWRRMLGYLRNYKRRLALAIFGTLASAGLSLVFPAIIQQVVDSALTEQNLDLLNQVTLFLLVVFLLRSITSFIEGYNLNYIGERIMVDLRTQLYTHLNTLSMGFFVERRVGELVSRMSSDVTTMRSVLTDNINVLLQQTTVMVGSVVVMFVINARLTLFILALIPVLVGLGFVFGFYLQRISTRIQDELAGSTVVMEESLQNIREVKSFVREPYEIQRYNDAITRSFKAAIQLLRITSVFGPFMLFLVFGSLALILWFGGQEVIAQRLTGGQLISFLFYGITVAGSFGSLVGLYTNFQKAIGSTKRVFELLDTQPSVKDKPDAQVITNVRGKIAFKDVDFTYDTKQEVLKGISLEVAEGEILAIVGASGAGKSTTFNLIPRFYDPTSGSVLLDGVDLRDITQASLRENIGIVPQETLLFGGTIRENIRYGKLDATEDEIIAAAKAANAHQFITELTDGYETVVGERGTKLSGGQRQRVAIARAILKNPRILLLDEATSSLDSESEQLVQEALSRLMQNRTTIIIAHRFSTVRVANRIAVLDKGELVELGTHDELIVKDGIYTKLYDLQLLNPDAPVEELA
ncbi:MAG TPA: ABC transporter transmembrane domain-containing protein [Aggregatilineales bacterium]|nr:ABC transporter transmembrane domain-containing protein [Aggregatilineales bacterium]